MPNKFRFPTGHKTRKTTMGSMRVNGEFRPNTVDLEKRTIEVVFTTGQGGKRYDWYNDVEYIEELDVTPESVRTERLDKGLSVIDNHDTYRGIDGVFGITEEYRFENGQLIGTVRFASDEESDKKFQKAADGILRHVSLGYKVHKYLKSRGETDKLDTYRAIDWEPTELSFTPVSFETENGTRSAERQNETTYEVEIEEIKMTQAQLARLLLLQGLQSRSTDEDSEMATLVALKTRTAAEVATPATIVRADPPPVPAVAPVVTVDTGAIRTEERGALVSFLDVAKKAGVQIEDATRAYTDGKSIDEYRTMIINNMGTASADNVVNTPTLTEDERSDQRANSRTDVENSLILRCSGSARNDVEMTDGIRDYRGLSLIETARQFMEDSGTPMRGLSPTKIAQRAFNSTSDFPLILENVMNKNLLGAYAETPQTFLGLGTKTELSDFREKHMYRLGEAADLLPLGEGGEYKSSTMAETKESYRLHTYARKIAFTRQMLINDSLDALDKVPMMFGRSGSKLESDIVWGLLLNWDFINNKAANIKMADGKALFHADHKNLLTGAGSVLSKDGLSALRKNGRKQTTMDGDTLNMVYNTLVMPSDLETTAEEILFNNYIANVSSETSSFRNKFEVRIEERLAVIATYGATAWYAFSNFIETFEYATLAGEPDMSTEIVNSTDADGMTVKVRKDFGAGLVDWRGMALCKGL